MSFTKYLIETYGIDTVITIINGEDESIYNAYHEDGLTGMIKDWIAFVDSHESNISEEAIASYMSRYFDTSITN